MTANTAANNPGGKPILDIGEFARVWSQGGTITLVATYPGHKLNAVTYDHDEADAGARAFVEVHQEDGANIYFTVNQTHGPISKKTAKTDMAAARAVWADIDPQDVEERKPGGWARERQRLLALATELAADPDFPPTIIIDSGNGIQPIWRLAEGYPLDGPNGEATRQIEAICRDIETALGGDNTFNVDRILRLPGTWNFPSATKKAKGRDTSQAKVLCWSGIEYSVAQLKELRDRLIAKAGLSSASQEQATKPLASKGEAAARNTLSSDHRRIA
jgi:hypothetical protein